ncbi:DUF4158 domain-containing protein [Providencia rettgeri]|nr:DUF4158 domain-containing protein [Providencia rettgeri]
MTSSRLSILTDEEIHSLYGIPNINNEEREFLFELDKDDIEYIHSIKNIGRKINYILQLGYYKATGYFSQFSFHKRKSDVDFILNRYFPNEVSPKKQIAKKYHYDNRRVILTKHNIKDDSNLIINSLNKESKKIVRRQVLPKLILQELLDYCLNENLLRPSYSKMQDIVSYAIRQEKQRLSNQIHKKIKPETRKELDGLLNMDDLFYKLTLIKKEQKNFTTTEIINTIKKKRMINSIFKESIDIISKLKISEHKHACGVSIAAKPLYF